MLSVGVILSFGLFVLALAALRLLARIDDKLTALADRPAPPPAPCVPSVKNEERTMWDPLPDDEGDGTGGMGHGETW